jgi:hypothetical protein
MSCGDGRGVKEKRGRKRKCVCEMEIIIRSLMNENPRANI